MARLSNVTATILIALNPEVQHIYALLYVIAC